MAVRQEGPSSLPPREGLPARACVSTHGRRHSRARGRGERVRAQVRKILGTLTLTLSLREREQGGDG
jgi:hypothetical protein